MVYSCYFYASINVFKFLYVFVNKDLGYHISFMYFLFYNLTHAYLKTLAKVMVQR